MPHGTGIVPVKVNSDWGSNNMGAITFHRWRDAGRCELREGRPIETRQTTSC